jgi:hypothetical protein
MLRDWPTDKTACPTSPPPLVRRFVRVLVLEIRPRGVMEYWSVGVLRQFGIAPRVRGVGSTFRRRGRRTSRGERRKVNYALSSWGLRAFPSRGTEATSTEPAGNVVLRLFLGRVREQLLRPVHLN